MDALVRRLALPSLVVLAVAPGAQAASVRSTNFQVTANSPEAARQIALHAEKCRREIALLWLGEELPPWSRPCPITVKLTDGEAGGLTSFSFDKGRVSDQEMSVEGRLDRILASALPHEITHTIFAAYFGGPMPRWADEGASLLSEDDREIRRHDGFVAELFQRRGELALAQLFNVKKYPRDLEGFYGQGYSVSRFLVETGGRPRFLKFVKDGMRTGWDQAARQHYGLADCRELDRAWKSWHRVVVATRSSDAPLVVRADASE